MSMGIKAATACLHFSKSFMSIPEERKEAVGHVTEQIHNTIMLAYRNAWYHHQENIGISVLCCQHWDLSPATPL